MLYAASPLLNAVGLNYRDSVLHHGVCQRSHFQGPHPARYLITTYSAMAEAYRLVIQLIVLGAGAMTCGCVLTNSQCTALSITGMSATDRFAIYHAMAEGIVTNIFDLHACNCTRGWTRCARHRV